MGERRARWGFGRRILTLTVVGCCAVNSLVLLGGSLLYFAIHTWLSLRSVYMLGLTVAVPVLSIIGLLELLSRTGVVGAGSHVSWGQAGLVFVWSFVYGATLGPAANTIACGVSASTLRPKTLALSRIAYDLLNLVQAAAGPYMLDPHAGNLQGFAALPAATFAALWLLWCFFRLPDMEGLSAAVLDHLFRSGVPARRFPDEAARLRGRCEVISGPDDKHGTPQLASPEGEIVESHGERTASLAS